MSLTVTGSTRGITTYTPVFTRCCNQNWAVTTSTIILTSTIENWSGTDFYRSSSLFLGRDGTGDSNDIAYVNDTLLFGDDTTFDQETGVTQLVFNRVSAVPLPASGLLLLLPMLGAVLVARRRV